MAQDIGSITLGGRLAADPEVKQVGDSTVGNFTLARSQYNGKGKEDSTAWWKCEVWGGLTNVLQYLRKGSKIVIVGEPRIDNPSEGKYYTKVKVSQIHLPDKKDNGGSDQGLKDRSPKSAPPADGAGF